MKVLDSLPNLGGEYLGQSLRILKPQGILVALGFVAGTEVSLHVRDVFFSQQQVRGSLMGSREDLEWGLDLVKQGRIRPLLDRVIALSEVGKTHELLQSSGIRGNVVLNPWA